MFTLWVSVGHSKPADLVTRPTARERNMQLAVAFCSTSLANPWIHCRDGENEAGAATDRSARKRGKRLTDPVQRRRKGRIASRRL